MSEAEPEGTGTAIEPAGDGWAHGYLPAVDLLGPPDTGSEEHQRTLHGPCAGCGFLFYTAQTRRPAQCPNCGHQATHQG